MKNAKNARAKQLITTLRLERDWSNEEFWEAKAILDSTPNSEMDAGTWVMTLMYAWGDVEGYRIDRGEHEGCGPELHAALLAKWPPVLATAPRRSI